MADWQKYCSHGVPLVRECKACEILFRERPRPRLSLADLDHRLEAFVNARLDAKAVPENQWTRHAMQNALTGIDNGLVAWFAERGIELVVDRDTLTHERLSQPTQQGEV